MRPRQNLIEIFSTFLQFDGERCIGWITDPKLLRSMQNCLAQSQQSKSEENVWILYWYKIWQSSLTSLAARPGALARSHLTAYLQETCYWVAYKTSTALTSAHYKLPDCFQIAIANIDTVLKGYNPTQGFALKNYASAIFTSTLHNFLRQRQEVDICSDYALLRRLSQKRLVESLQQVGVSEEKIASYVLAWKCFQTIYVPKQGTATRKLLAPDRATWEAIANLYNEQRISQLHPSARAENPENLEKWLLVAAKAARNYLYPTFVSLNAPKPGQDADQFLDSLPESATESLLTEMIALEEQQNRAVQLSQMNGILTTKLAQLNQEAQTILQLYYAQGLTQQQIAKQLNLKQYTVSRRLTKTRELLLLALGQWSQDTLHISLTSDVLKDINIVLESWLDAYYH